MKLLNLLIARSRDSQKTSLNASSSGCESHSYDFLLKSISHSDGNISRALPIVDDKVLWRLISPPPWVTLLTSKSRDNTFLRHAISKCSRLLETIVEQRNESDKKHCRVVNCLSLENSFWKAIKYERRWHGGRQSEMSENIILQYHTHLLHALRGAEIYETISKWCFMNADLL